MQLRSFGTLGLLLAAATVMGCADNGPGTGQLTVRMTDAPFPFSEVSQVNVHVVRIDARVDGVSEAEAADDENMSGWITLVEPNATLNLLTLQGGKTADLGVATLPTGIYSSFRVVLNTDETSVLVNDGTEVPLEVDIKFPSGATSGIKVNLTEPVQVDEGHSLMILDFDIGSSFVLRGNDVLKNGLIFKPVIRVVAVATGSVSGSVRSGSEAGDPVPGATVELLTAGTPLGDDNPDNIVASTATDNDGNYNFAFVAPGTYELRATPPEGTGLAAALYPGGVTVVSNTALTDRIIVVE